MMFDKEKVEVVILAGGRGARFDHETQVLPKPLIEVAGKPMLGHIMDLFEAQGFKRFTVLGGYKWEKIHEYLSTRYECAAEARDYIRVYGSKGEKPTCHLFNTGEDATTGDRLMTMMLDFWPPPDVLGGSNFFILTYGDGLSDVDMDDVICQHLQYSKPNNAICTVTCVNPPGRFGVVEFGGEMDQLITQFYEKGDQDWINGGFMVVDHGIISRWVPKDPGDFDGPFESFESGAMNRLAYAKRLYAYRHDGYWRCMDSRRDLEAIEQDIKDEYGGRLPWMNGRD